MNHSTYNIYVANDRLVSICSVLLFFPRTFLKKVLCTSFTTSVLMPLSRLTNDMTIPPQTLLNYGIFDRHDNTHLIPKNISRHPINQPHSTHHPDHTTLHPTQPHFIRNSKFPRFTTVQ